MRSTTGGPAPRYDVRISATASKELAALSKDLQRRIAARLRALATNPRPRGATALTGSDQLRLRIGDYRVIYGIRDQALVAWSSEWPTAERPTNESNHGQPGRPSWDWLQRLSAP